MKIVIPPTRRKKLKRSKALVNEILLNGKCKILKRVKIEGKGVRIEAEKPLKNGRLHIIVSNPHGRYILNIHFDPTKHFGILHPPPAIKSKLGMYPIYNCKEIMDFVEEFIIPVIRKYRPNYS